LNAGARLDIDERFGSHFSAARRARLAPRDAVERAKLMYAEAFRAPTAFDIYY